MDINNAIKVLEALASGCSPTTGEVINDDSTLNDRNVIRALQIAIDHLRKENSSKQSEIKIDERDIENVIQLFKEQRKSPTSINLTSFFLATRPFKNQNLVSSKLYGKFRNIYNTGQLIDFFSKYLSDNNITTKNSSGNDSYKLIDFFEKEKFNKLSESAITQLKEKINQLGVLKTENLSEYIQEARKTHLRAYEHWSDNEIELLTKAIKYTNDLNLLSDCFQRGKRSIESVGQKIIFASQNTETKL
ncbi:MAG: hypothetical protein QM781_16835 [Chitinophagaceae bacterium]